MSANAQAPDSASLPQAEREAITAMSFEQAMKALEDIVRRLESGSGDLESSIADYVRGTALREHCQKKLDDAKLKVEAILRAQDGSVRTEPFSLS